MEGGQEADRRTGRLEGTKKRKIVKWKTYKSARHANNDNLSTSGRGILQLQVELCVGNGLIYLFDLGVLILGCESF